MNQDKSIQLENYLNNLPKTVGNYNAKLIREFIERYRALPSEPADGRCLNQSGRLKTICILLENKQLDNLTEKDLEILNLKMREKKMLSAADYRKVLKKFLILKGKKRYFDLIDSDFLKNSKKKCNGEKLVDPETFWNQKEIESYLQESLRHSLRQAAWAGLWLSTGCRPHELFNLTKNDIVWEESKQRLVIKVRAGKTGSRIVPFQGDEATGIFRYVKPYLENLNSDDLLFPRSYNAQLKIHKKLCKRIGLSKDKDWHFYMARKMNLTRFYNTFGLVKAAQIAGHVAGSPIIKHYVALTEEQLQENNLQLKTVSIKTCPNPNCKTTNEPHHTQCNKCGAPLDRQAFDEIIKTNLDELIETKLELFKEKLEKTILMTAIKTNNV